MAKVKMPLMSGDARGKFGGVIVFSAWKGRQTVRKLVTPANPQSVDQVKTRNAMRVAAACQNWANRSTMHAPTQTTTDKARIMAITPSGFAWNGYFVESIIGKGMIGYNAAVTAYTALTAPQKTAWDTAATAVTPDVLAVAQGITGGGAGTPMIAGEVWFIYQYGLSLIGLATTPSAVPPTYT